MGETAVGMELVGAKAVDVGAVANGEKVWTAEEAEAEERRRGE